MEYSHGLPPVPGETIPPDPPLMTSQTQTYLIDTLERHKAQTEIGLHHLLRRLKRFLALGLPILLIILIIAPEFINLIWAILDPSPNYLVLTLQRYTYITLQFCIVTVAAIFYYVAIGSKIIATKGALKSLGESLYLKRFATYEGRMLLLRKELARLMNKTAQVFFENQERYEQAVKWHKEAGYTLDRLEKAEDVKIDMRSANTAGETKTV